MNAARPDAVLTHGRAENDTTPVARQAPEAEVAEEEEERVLGCDGAW